MKTENRIRQLQDKWTQAYQCLQSEELPDHEFMQGAAFTRVLETLIMDLHRRKIQQREGTFPEWMQVTVAIQLCNTLMGQLRTEEADALKGWNFWKPENEVQEAYSFLYEVLMDLGEGAVEIEDQNPDEADRFEYIRSEYPPMVPSF